MDFEIVPKKKISIKIGESVYNLSKLTVGQIRAMESKSILEKLKKGSEDPTGAVIAGADMLCLMGLPQDVVDSLDAEEIAAIMEYVSGPKKN